MRELLEAAVRMVRDRGRGHPPDKATVPLHRCQVRPDIERPKRLGEHDVRLNGRRGILHHLGRSWSNRRAWRWIRRAYAPVIYYLPSRRVWTTTEELDAVDRARSRTAEDVLSGREGW